MTNLFIMVYQEGPSSSRFAASCSILLYYQFPQLRKTTGIDKMKFWGLRTAVLKQKDYKLQCV